MVEGSESVKTKATVRSHALRSEAVILREDEKLLRRRSQPEALCGIGPPAAEVLSVFDRVLTSRKSEALLIWPQRPESIAVFHALAALSRIGNCDREGLKTLFFPWSRSTGNTQRTLLVDRTYIYKTTLPALNRVYPESTRNPAFGYLMALHSLNHLLLSGKKDKGFRKALEGDPGLMHPTLFEIMPQVGIENAGLHTYEDQFLRRLRRHTWIAERQEYIDAAADPVRTPFFLFGIHGDAVRVSLLRTAGLDPRHGGRRPDIVLIDLTRGARNRLEKSWRHGLSRFLGIIQDLYGDEFPPVLAVTDDVFVVQALRWEIINNYDIRRRADPSHKRPGTARIVLSPKPDPLDHETIAPVCLSEIRAEVYGADVLSVVDFGLKLRRSLLDAGDDEIAAAVTAAIDVLQNLIGLPGLPQQFHQFLTASYDGYEHQGIGARFDHHTPRGKISSALKHGMAGSNHNQLSQFLSEFDNLCGVADTDNPGHKLFDECIRSLCRKVTRSIVVFPSEVLRGFAEWRIENDAALADLRSSLGRKLIMVDRREAIEALELSQQDQELFQQIVFVEPHPEDLLHVLTCPWLPQKVTILANLARAEQTLRRIRILLDIDGIAPIMDKLIAVQKEFESGLEGHIINIPDLDEALPMPRLGTLDLTVTGTPGSGATRIIRTSGDLQIRAFDGSEVALYDPEALQVFSRKLAKDLRPGDQIFA